MFGFLNLNKPQGWSSRDAVNRVQKLVKPEKVGHAGTLDPLATGVLVIGVGQATRLVEYLQQQSKGYLGTFLLGRESDTEDVEGNVLELPSPPIPTLEQLTAALPKFIGEVDQMPPAYSALKVDGQRAYKLARQGEEVKLASRKITVHALSIESYSYPTLQLKIECGSGTYVRSLGRDLAREVGTQAVMSALVRTHIGAFRLEDAISPDGITREQIQTHLQPAQLAVSQLASIALSDVDIANILMGRSLTRLEDLPVGELAGVDAAGRLIAILATTGTLVRPVRVFPPS